MQGKGHGHVSPDITGPRTILWRLYEVPQKGALFLLIPVAVVNPGSSGSAPKPQRRQGKHTLLFILGSYD